MALLVFAGCHGTGSSIPDAGLTERDGGTGEIDGGTVQVDGGTAGGCPANKRVITAEDVDQLKNSGYPEGTEVFVAGGPDPWGGCFPGPGNTGIPAGVQLTDYTGPCDITSDGTTVEAKLISNCYTLSIHANDVTITNSKFVGSNIDVESGSLQISDSEADFGADRDGQGFTGSNIVAERLNFFGGHRQVWCDHCTVEDSYFHGQNISQDPEAHASAVRTEAFTTYRHNTIACDVAETPEGGGCSAAQTGYPDFGPIHDNTVDKNFIVAPTASGYCAYGGWNPGKPFNDDPLNATYIAFTNNVVQRGTVANDIKDWQEPLTDKDRYTCGFWGPTTSYRPDRTGSVLWDDGLLWEDDTAALYYPFHE